MNSGGEQLTIIITIFSAVFLPAITGLVTWMATRSNIRNDTKRLQIEDNRTGVDTQFTLVNAANQSAGNAMQQAQFLTGALNQTLMDKIQLSQQVNQKDQIISRMLIQKDRVIAAIRDLFAEHAEAYTRAGVQCGFFDQLQSRMSEILAIFEKDA